MSVCVCVCVRVLNTKQLNGMKCKRELSERQRRTDWTNREEEEEEEE